MAQGCPIIGLLPLVPGSRTRSRCIRGVAGCQVPGGLGEGEGRVGCWRGERRGGASGVGERRSEEALVLMGVAWVFVALSIVLGACSTSEKEEILDSANLASDAGTGSRYEKPAGVVCHIPAILGMEYDAFDGSDVARHLGAVVSEQRLPGVRGRSVVYEHGELLVARGRIYGVVYRFDRPVTLLEALHTVGLPESLGSEFTPTSRELRIERSPYGYRRLVLERSAPWEDRFVAIRAWRILPQEKY